MEDKIPKSYLAIDIGATSGRVISYTLKDNKIVENEIHRFKNIIIKESQIYRWDFNYLYQEIITGLKLSFSKFKNIISIGIDTWGCDFGVINEKGKLIENPVSYRDKGALNYIKQSEEIISRKDLYQKTGIQHLPFNTIYQLLYSKDRLKEIDVNKYLMIPDLIAYFLTGNSYIERTNASTTSLYNPIKRDWIDKIEELGINKTNFPPFIDSGKSYGLLTESTKKELELDYDVKVIAVGTHDTSSAFASINLDKKEVLINSGTWSVLGVITDKPIINDISRKLNFSNEVAIDNKIRFLKNIIGMWILERVKREYEEKGFIYDYKDIINLATKSSEFKTYINVDDETFINPPNMIEAIRNYCFINKVNIPNTPGEIFISIYRNIAYKYNSVIKDLESITNNNFNSIKIIGGGAKNDYFNQMISDITRRKVVVGPIEATIIGNLKVQLISDGISKEDINNYIKTLYEVKVFLPKAIEDKFELYEKAINI